MSRRICPICNRPCRWANRKKGRIYVRENNGPNDAGGSHSEDAAELLLHSLHTANPCRITTNILGERIPPHPK